MSEDTDLGFDWSLRKDGTLVVSRHGASVTEMRGVTAQKALSRIEAAGGGADAQQVLARLTGNYKRGNERPTGKAGPDG